MTTPPNLKRKLSWRLRVLMAERGITTATDLQRRLANVGFHITSAQLTRIIQKRPERVSTELLDSLLEVLGCAIGDLLHRELVEAEGESGGEPKATESFAPKPKTPRVRRQAMAPEAAGDLTGPKVMPFPVPPKK